MKKRKCAKCDTDLSDEDVMKLQFEDGSTEIIPLPLCPDCFAKQLRRRAREQ